ncbi:hypothetical protein D3C83_226690 [compost metagenome]
MQPPLFDPQADDARWKDASQATVDQWYADATAAGFDGKALHEQALALVDKHAVA